MSVRKPGSVERYQTPDPFFSPTRVLMLALVSLVTWWALWRVAVQPAFVLSGQASYQSYRTEYEGYRYAPRTHHTYVPATPQDSLSWGSLILVAAFLSAWSWSFYHAGPRGKRPPGWVDLDVCPERLWQQAIDDPEVSGLLLTVQDPNPKATASGGLALALSPVTFFGSLLLLVLAPALALRFGWAYLTVPTALFLSWAWLLRPVSGGQMQLNFFPPSATALGRSLSPRALLLSLTTTRGGQLFLQSDEGSWPLRSSQQNAVLTAWAHSLARRLQLPQPGSTTTGEAEQAQNPKS